MKIRKSILIFSGSLIFSCLAPGPCDNSSWRNTYLKPITTNYLKGCWDYLYTIGGVTEVDSSFMNCYGDSTISSYRDLPSLNRRQFYCASYRVDSLNNKMYFDSSISEEYELRGGIWILTLLFRSTANQIISKNYTHSGDTLINYDLTSYQDYCGSPVVGESKSIRHNRNIDSSGIAHCDSLGYK